MMPALALSRSIRMRDRSRTLSPDVRRSLPMARFRRMGEYTAPLHERACDRNRRAFRMKRALDEKRRKRRFGWRNWIESRECDGFGDGESRIRWILSMSKGKAGVSRVGRGRGGWRVDGAEAAILGYREDDERGFLLPERASALFGSEVRRWFRRRAGSRLALGRPRGFFWSVEMLRDGSDASSRLAVPAASSGDAGFSACAARSVVQRARVLPSGVFGPTSLHTAHRIPPCVSEGRRTRASMRFGARILCFHALETPRSTAIFHIS